MPDRRPPDRRGLLAAGIGACLLAPLGPALVGRADPAVPTLRSLAAARGLAFGAEILSRELATDPAYRSLFAAQCAILVPGFEAKWDQVEPRPGEYVWGPLDRIVDFAEANAIAVRMHTLVWALAMPPWLQALLRSGDAGAARAALEAHVASVCGRYRGRVAAWDVVNEASDPVWHRGPEGLTLSPWRRALGPDYVPIAFAAARAADPGARLFLNEDGLEYAGARFNDKRATYVRLVEGWLRDGVPIEGFGLQTHLHPDLPLDLPAYRRFLATLAGFGLELHLTELDVRDRTLPADPATRDRIAAALVRRVLDTALDEPAVTTIVTWGLTDRYSYQLADPAFRRPDGLPNRGLPWDAALRPTPIHDAIAAAILGARYRAPGGAATAG